MIGDMLENFIKSPAAQESIQEVAAKAGLSTSQAEEAVKATAEGAAESSSEGGLAGMASSLLGGGGGLAGMASSLLGGGGGASLPAELVEKVSSFVAEKTGIDAAMAKTVVEVALPKVLAFVKG